MKDANGFPYDIVAITMPNAERWSFLVKAWSGSFVTVARLAIDDNEHGPPLSFQGVWDAGARVIRCEAPSWNGDSSSELIRGEMGLAFFPALSAWSRALATLSERGHEPV
jgi:hypothetical protein